MLQIDQSCMHTLQYAPSNQVTKVLVTNHKQSALRVIVTHPAVSVAEAHPHHFYDLYASSALEDGVHAHALWLCMQCRQAMGSMGMLRCAQPPVRVALPIY